MFCHKSAVPRGKNQGILESDTKNNNNKKCADIKVNYGWQNIHAFTCEMEQILKKFLLLYK